MGRDGAGMVNGTAIPAATCSAEATPGASEARRTMSGSTRRMMGFSS